MGQLKVKRLSWIPNAVGTLTRLAYAHAKACGIDSKHLLKEAKLTITQIKNPNLRLRVGHQIKFLNLAAAALRDDLLGFHLAQRVDLREFGFLYYISASSEKLGDALQRVAHYSSIANEGVSLSYFDGKNIGVTFRYVGVSRHLDCHQIEYFTASLVRLCRHLTGMRLVPISVQFTHYRDSMYRELIKFFGTAVEFGATIDGISFAATVKDIPIVSADHYLNKLLVTYCEEALSGRSPMRGSIRSRVENIIVPLLPHGVVCLEDIARRLGISQRTLARRLSAEKVTFTDVLQDLKIDLAKRYLVDPDISISQIAWLLGYQEVSSFTHAFKSWTNKTPRQFRYQLLS